jgi:hypothetical protein
MVIQYQRGRLRDDAQRLAALTAEPAFVSGKSHGRPEFQARGEAVLIGRKTFEPALGADRWPWPNLDAFVLGSNVPTDGTPVPIEANSSDSTGPRNSVLWAEL